MVCQCSSVQDACRLEVLPNNTQLGCTSSCQQPQRWCANSDVGVHPGRRLPQSERAAQRVLCKRRVKQVQQQKDDQTMVCLTTSEGKEASKRCLRRGVHML